jgi:hypothetical protein
VSLAKRILKAQTLRPTTFKIRSARSLNARVLEILKKDEKGAKKERNIFGLCRRYAGRFFSA